MRLRCALVALWLTIGGGTRVALAAPVNGDVIVSTLAGSGKLGIDDGPASGASFVMPTGLAYAPDGTLYVSDGGGQRIRRIATDGSVTTVAGGGTLAAGATWVEGGYRDGRGTDARFDRPAGIVWRAGDLYVADTNNHCIRRIAPDGTVSTYAGSPQRTGIDDGPVARASFVRPTGLATDRGGNLYVADAGSGFRVISPSGIVTRVSDLSAGSPLGVAIADSQAGPVIFIADFFGLLRRDPDGKTERIASNQVPLAAGSVPVQGGEPIGYPFGIAVFNANEVVFTDPRGDSVRYIDWAARAPQLLGGRDTFDGWASAAGYRDGAGSVALFGAPLGIATSAAGTIAVADGGSRRVRLISHFDRSHIAYAAGVSPPDPDRDPKHYRIAFVGNSYLWDYVLWADSIPGIVEHDLRNDLSIARTGRSPVVVPFVFPHAGFKDLASYVREVLAGARAADLVVLNFNPRNLGDQPAAEQIAEAGRWIPEITAAIRSSAAELKAAGATLVVYTSPVAEDLSPAEQIWAHLASPEGQSAPQRTLGDLMNRAVSDAGVPFFDAWKLLDDETLSPDHAPLFGTDDPHFSEHGRAIVGDALAHFLQRLAPWSAP